MRLAKIYLPTRDNDGHSLRGAHTALQLQLMKLFGGYTEITARGGWRSPGGDIYREPVTIYEVATRSNDHTVEADLRRIAEGLRIEARQEQVMIVLADGEVMMVTGEA